ncbi:hypothetical protein ACFX13_013003 [Malus domestica]
MENHDQGYLSGTKPTESSGSFFFEGQVGVVLLQSWLRDQASSQAFHVKKDPEDPVGLGQLEEIRRSQSHSCSHTHTPKSSSLTSTPSRTSGTLTSEGGKLPSSAELIFSESLEKHCRPIEHVMMETDAKGSLIERLDHVEDRVLKLCVQLEEEFMESSAEKKRGDEAEMIKRSEKEREEMIRRSEKEEKIDISEVERILSRWKALDVKSCER